MSIRDSATAVTHKFAPEDYAATLYCLRQLLPRASKFLRPRRFLMLSRRMPVSSAAYASSINRSSINDEIVEEGTNPLHNTGPSNAYRESLRKAQSSERGNADITYVKVPGRKTIAVALFLFIGGWILFIIGAVFYWNTSDWSTLKGATQAQGLDMIIAGSVMLLPGSYASIGLYGAWRKWRGYSFDAIPLFDYTLRREDE